MVKIVNFSFSTPFSFIIHHHSLMESNLALALEEHVGNRVETNASAEDVLNALALSCEDVDDWGSLGDARSLEQIREDAEDAVKVLKSFGLVCLVLDAGHELGDDDEVEHDWRSEQRILACVVQCDGVAASHVDLAGVLVHGSLRVAHIGDVLDHNDVVGVLAWGVQDWVGGNNISHDVALGDFL